MFCNIAKIILILTAFAVVVTVNQVAIPAYADDGGDPQSTLDTDQEREDSITGDEPNNNRSSVEGGESETEGGAEIQIPPRVNPATDFELNPWGCVGDPNMPHESERNPGPGWIQAKATISCKIAPPEDAVWIIGQWLQRSSWSGWRTEAGLKESVCPAGTGKPQCATNGKYMRAYINWDCDKDTWYNYRQIADYQLIVGPRVYYTMNSRETGAWDEEGTVKCTK